MAATDDDKAALDASQGLFAQRAERSLMLNVLIALALVAVVATSWPTQARKLERRAVDFADAVNRNDFARAYEALAPGIRGRLSLKEWAASRPARGEVEAVEIGPNGTTATVTLSDERRQKFTRNWVMVGSEWYCDCGPG